MRIRFTAILAAILLLGIGAASRAQVAPVLVTIDENGNGTVSFNGGAPTSLDSFFEPDHLPGGLPNVLAYFYPVLVGNRGDLVLTEPGGNSVSDVIRFEDPFNAGIFFYSDNADGKDAAGDLGLPTGPDGFPVVTLPEVKLADGTVGAMYTPNPDQPGFFPGITYHIISDAEVSSVPEPGSIAFFAGLGITGSLLALRRRKS